MNKLGIGIIGCGTILPVHLDSIHAYHGAELLMVCDINESLAEQIGNKEGCSWVSDFNEILDNGAIDLVHILLPHYLHTPMAIKALKKGKHVVLEKPVGISLEELKVLEDVAAETKLTVGVTFQNRFNPTTIKMKEILATGQLGQLIASKGYLTWCRKDAYYSESDWRGKLATEGGGLLINQAIHTLDLLEYLGGPIKDIKATIANHTHPEIEVEDTAMVVMSYENGATGHFFGTNSYGANSAIEMGFVFEKGQLLFKDEQLTLVQDKHSEVIASDLVKKGEKSYWGMSHQVIIKDIYESVIRKREPKVTLSQAIRATELVLLCYQ